jgi:hypothetical protein
MKIRKLERSCLMLIVVIFSVFLLKASFSVSADKSEATKETESCNVDADGTCDPFKKWVDEVGDKTKQFLQSKVFGQTQAEQGSQEFLTQVFQQDQDSSSQKDQPHPYLPLFDRLQDLFFKAGDEQNPEKEQAPTSDEILAAILDRAHIFGNEEQNGANGMDFVNLLGDAFKKVMDQLKSTFGDILDGLDGLITVSMIYYAGEEDARKNPTWKRRQHRFYDQISQELVLELHDALYLSQLSYVDTVEEFKKGLATFRNNTWELVYGTTESLPHLPAHFLCIHKQLAPLQKQYRLPWKTKQDDAIQVGIVVRGTKHIADAMADGMLEPVEYRDGHAHGGILMSGKALVEKHLPRLKELLKYSGRNKITLYLVGHSLGAGAAAIAAMEFREYDFIEVKALGFGCPSILSHNLSLATKDYITTVVADADVVPRMSGASMANALMDLLEYDYTNEVIADGEYSLERARKVLKLGHMLPKKETMRKWLDDFFDKEVRPRLGKEKRPRLENVLVPPGNCIHIFRDGVGYSGTYTPCDFFSSIDLVRTLIDDHLVMSGYHRALISLVRDRTQNYKVRLSMCSRKILRGCRLTLPPF